MALFNNRVRLFQTKADNFRSKIFFRTMAIVYLALLIIGVVPVVGAECREDRVYPLCFLCLMIVHMINFVIATTLWFKEYMIREDLVQLHSNQTLKPDSEKIGDSAALLIASEDVAEPPHTQPIGHTTEGTRSERGDSEPNLIS